MHQALLIDEILRLILENYSGFDKTSLCSMARCCKAWKDPALDRLWRCLPSAIPLLALLPGFSFNAGVITLEQSWQDEDLAIFRAYSRRVKYIVYRHEIRATSELCLQRLWNTGHLLDNLEACHIESRAAVNLPLCMSTSPCLRAVSVNVGYAVSKVASSITHGVLSRLKGTRSLQRLSLRGYNTVCLQQPFSALVTLQSLSLYLTTLTTSTFMAISSLPILSRFDVHAKSLSVEHLSTAMTSHRAQCIPFFPSLRNLKIRAQLSVIELVLQHIPHDNLRTLHIDIDRGARLIPWHSTLLTITAATSVLQDLTLEDILLVDDPRNIQTFTINHKLTIDDLRILSKLPLRRLIVDTSTIPDLMDTDVEEMVNWWPHLQSLHLGGDRVALENMGPAWQPRMSLASLSTIAKGCRRLTELVLTLDVASPVPRPLCTTHHQLSWLIISSLSKPDVEALPVFLKYLFPSLMEIIPGYVGDHSEAWEALQHNYTQLDTPRQT